MVNTSKGLHCQQSTMSVSEHKLSVGTILCLKRYNSSRTTTTKWVVIGDIEILETNHELIVHPRSLIEDAKGLTVGTTVAPTRSQRIRFGIPPPTIVAQSRNIPTPIRKLNPYQTRWMVKCHVTSKGEKRQYTNQRGPGQVFSFDIIDSEGSETRVTSFNEVVDLYFSNIEKGAMYTISGRDVKTANKMYNKLNSGLEIILSKDSKVCLCQDDQTIPAHQFHFTPITHIVDMSDNANVDIIGVVTFVGSSSTLRRRDNTEVQHRAVRLLDKFGTTIDLTLWGQLAGKEGNQIYRQYEQHQETVIALKNGRVGQYHGKVVSTSAASNLMIDPDIEEAQQIQTWYNEIGAGSEAATATLGMCIARMSILEIREKMENIAEPLHCTIKATVLTIKQDDLYYPACPTETGECLCNKKLTEEEDGRWLCSKCNLSHSDYNYRYLLQMNVQDHTDELWAIAFDEVSTQFLGIPAKELCSAESLQEDEYFS